MRRSEFNWGDNPDVALGEQRAVAIYPNVRGEIVIRQEKSWDEEDDTIVLLQREHLIAIAYRLLDETGRDLQIVERVDGGWIDIERPAARPRTDIDWQAANRDLQGPAPALADEPVGERGKPKDTTAAERMRRYRERKRNAAESTVTVTPPLALEVVD